MEECDRPRAFAEALAGAIAASRGSTDTLVPLIQMDSEFHSDPFGFGQEGLFLGPALWAGA